MYTLSVDQHYIWKYAIQKVKSLMPLIFQFNYVSSIGLMFGWSIDFSFSARNLRLFFSPKSIAFRQESSLNDDWWIYLSFHSQIQYLETFSITVLKDLKDFFW